MKYDIPDELAPYLEYIPDEMLSDIITEALRDAIFRNHAKTTDNTLQQVDMSELLEQIKSLAGSGAAKQMETSLKKPKQEKTAPIVVTTPVAEDIDNDLKDIVMNFAGNLIK